jgi:hypothetical protein
VAEKVGDRVEVGDDIVELERNFERPFEHPSRYMGSRDRYLTAFHYGTLTEIFVSEGQRVKSGQAIASLTPWPCPTPTSTTLVEMTNILKDSPPKKKVTVGGVFHFIGWLTVVVLLWRVWGWVDRIMADISPFWLRWLIELPLAVVVLGINGFLLLTHGIAQTQKASRDIFEPETKAWLQTHWSSLPANCKIVDREDGPPWYGDPGSAAGTRIRINDGYGLTINLYYDLRTKQMLACRAYPSPGR